MCHPSQATDKQVCDFFRGSNTALDYALVEEAAVKFGPVMSPEAVSYIAEEYIKHARLVALFSAGNAVLQRASGVRA